VVRVPVAMPPLEEVLDDVRQTLLVWLHPRLRADLSLTGSRSHHSSLTTVAGLQNVVSTIGVPARTRPLSM
jgi:hypothetical protein